MDEKSRLNQLRNYQILDSGSDEHFDALTELASSIFDTKISLISLVDEHRQWFKSRVGLDITETEREHSFCSVAIEDKNNVMVVPNAKLDERFKNNPFVTGDPNIVFYAGAPVVDSEGYALGTICIIDSFEKEFTQKDIITLAALAKVVAEKIESKKLKNDLLKESKVREESEQRIAQAEVAAIRKSRFLANISHEIRTPLTTIITLSELLSEEKLPDDLVDDLNDIVSSAHHLNKMIGGILDFSKIESGQLPIIPVKTELRTFIRAVSRSLQTSAENKNIKYEVDVIGVLPEFIEIDSTRARQVIDNLTSNACKFTLSGGLVRLVITASEGFIDFSVIDTGAGIPESVVDKIFEPYFQLDGSLARRESGIGLGLAISKELAGIMGGELSVTSEFEKGSTFIFSLPYNEAMVSNRSTIASCRLFLEKKILIADDNSVNRRALVRMLKSMGIDTIEAKDGEEVLEAINNKDLDLVLLDVHMPKMDGLEVLKMLNVKETSRPPIAMLTACATKEERQNAFRLGAEGYIVKPFGRRALETELETLFTLQSVDRKIS